MSPIEFNVIQNSDKFLSTLKLVLMIILFSGVSISIYFKSEIYFSTNALFAGFDDLSENFNTTGVYILNHPIDGPVVNSLSLKYRINQPHKCTVQGNPTSDGISEKFDDLFSIIYVHSASENFNRRILIRRTWGNCSALEYPCRILFFLGLPQKVGVQEAIEVEAGAYKDIIQEDFIDHYHNLTNKAIGAMKWISEFCPRARFIVKSDDDMFVNTIKLFRLLDLKYHGPIRRKLFCNVWTRSPVLRYGRWKVSKKDLPQHHYPMYCSGSTFVLSGDLAPDLFKISHYVPFLWVDDVYLTGFLRQKLGNVTFVYLNRFYSFTTTTSDQFLFVHTDKSEVVKELWKSATTT